MRHSAAHIMADAVMQLFPEAKVGIGPPTADGFYYVFDVDQPFTPEDLERIESLMLDTIRSDAPFVREELTRDSAKSMFPPSHTSRRSSTTCRTRPLSASTATANSPTSVRDLMWPAPAKSPR